MAQEQNYQVNYSINVDASQGTKQVIAFGEAVGKLVQAKASLTPAVTNIKNMMDEIDRVFRTKNGKKRNFDYRLTIDTKKSEEKLERIKGLLTDISTLSKGISLTINAGQALDSKKIKANAKSLYEKKAAEMRKAEIEKNAASSVGTMADAQKRITKAIGKINSALVSMERDRELQIKTGTAENRLQQILSLLGRIKSASVISFNMQGGIPSEGLTPSVPVPYAPQAFVMPEKARQKLMERLYAGQQLHRQKLVHAEELFTADQRRKAALAETAAAEKRRADEARAKERECKNAARAAEKIRRQAEQARRKAETERIKAEQAARRQEQRNAMQSVRLMQREHTAAGTLYRSKRRAAINRIQYSKAPSLRNLPFASMLNAYMGYSLIRSELTKAIDYSNIMESAHSILRVADSDLKTFETRFDSMARHVRKIGIDTKYTAVEIAGAVKYLSMAGMNIETINKSIRPITNLALIGDNDVSYIADLATNIMAGYDIHNDSMDSVADIISSTISRSNVNIVEMAESYKMAAGYLRMAGVDFTESSAAIGLLGNMGLKGTLAGTSLRALSTRFAKPTKEAQEVLDRLGIRFTEMRDIEGVQVEKLRPIADIFEELNKKGASMADVQAIFGKIGGNAAMMFLKNYDKLRELTSYNRGSQGVSSELALVKQNTTKGLWAQVTSQLTEGFMQAYEVLEPSIRTVLRTFLAKFKAPEFTRGLVSIGNALLDIFTVIGNIGAWVTRNFHWIEPLVFTGVVATRLFKVAGALTNIGIAMGFIGKQSAATTSISAVQGLLGAGGIGKVSFAQKRAIVSAMQSAGVAGRGAMNRALMAGGGVIGAKGVLQSLFATQVATGSGLTGAAASLSAISTGAVAATAGIAALVGTLGWVAYKTWKIKEAKDAVLEEIESNRKYRYPSIEALYSSLSETYNMAVKTKRAVDEVVAGKSIEEASGHKIGAFTSNWWAGFLGEFAIASSEGMVSRDHVYNMDKARQDDIRDALVTLAKRDSQIPEIEFRIVEQIIIDYYDAYFNGFTRYTDEQREVLLKNLFAAASRKNPNKPPREVDEMVRKQIEVLEARRAALKVSELNFNSFFDYSFDRLEQICTENDITTISYSTYSTMLQPFYKGGAYEKILNENVDSALFDETFIVFEVDAIKENKKLFPIVTLIIMDVFLQKMRIKKTRKVLVIEEAWKAIASPLMAEYIKFMYKTARKFWASVGVVTQEIQDIIGSEIVKEAIINNSDVVMLLDQSKFKERFDEIRKILGLTEVDCKKIFTINRLENKDGRSFFREVFIRRGTTSGVYGVEEPHECYMTYTTERAEKEALKLYKKELRCSHQEAIEAYCRDWDASGIGKALPFAQKVNETGRVLNLRPVHESK